MITILAAFCLLTLSYVDCGPKSTMCLTYFKEIEHWPVKEAWVDWEHTVAPPVHYTGPLKLTKYDVTFSLSTLSDDDSVEKNVLCFEITDLYAFLDDTVYVVTPNPRRIVRMSMADRNKLKSFKMFFEYETIDQTFVARSRFDLVKIVELDEHFNFKRIASSDYSGSPIILTELVELDKIGNDTGKRRFIISGDVGNELFAVFNKGDYNFIQKGVSNRFALEVQPPPSYKGKMYYGLMMTCINDTPKNFTEEMGRHVSPLITVPEVVLSLSTALFNEDGRALVTLAENL